MIRYVLNFFALTAAIAVFALLSGMFLVGVSVSASSISLSIFLLSPIISVAILLIKRRRDTKIEKLKDTPTKRLEPNVAGLTSSSESPRDLAPFFSSFSEHTVPVATKICLTYQARDGSLSERCISVKRFTEQDNPSAYFFGHCHLRKAGRTFLFKRVRDAWDDETGEIIPDLQEHLRTKYMQTDHYKISTLVEDHHEILRALVFISRIDGAMRKPERLAILSLIKRLVNDDDLTEEVVRNALDAVEPASMASFKRLCTKVSQMEQYNPKVVAEFLADFRNTKKSVSPAEEQVLSYWEKALQSHNQHV